MKQKIPLLIDIHFNLLLMILKKLICIPLELRKILIKKLIKKVYIKGQIPLCTGIPGPGTYDVRTKPGKESLKYSLRPRTTLGLLIR